MALPRKPPRSNSGRLFARKWPDWRNCGIRLSRPAVADSCPRPRHPHRCRRLPHRIVKSVLDVARSSPETTICFASKTTEASAFCHLASFSNCSTVDWTDSYTSKPRRLTRPRGPVTPRSISTIVPPARITFGRKGIPLFARPMNLGTSPSRPRQICVLGSAEPGSPAYELAGAAGELIARLGLTLVSGCGSPGHARRRGALPRCWRYRG